MSFAARSLLFDPAMPLVTVTDLLRARAASVPDDVALSVEAGRSLTYGDWEHWSNAAATGLLARGVGPGDLVGLVFDTARWDAYAVAYMGVQKSGATAVPIGLNSGGADLARLLTHSGAVGVICPPDLRPRVEEVGQRAWIVSLAELKAGQRAENAVAFVGPAIRGSELAEVIYTSGTTGTPKGVACSHDSIVIHDGPPEPEGARVILLHAFPVGTNACQELMRICLRRGDRIPLAMAGFDPERAASLVERLGIARMQLVPAMASLLLDSGACTRHDMTSLKVLTLSSAPAPPVLLSRLGDMLPGVRLVNAYALTESGTARTINFDARSRPDSVGRPVGATEVRIADEAGRALPAGQSGEIWLRRPGAPQRYYLHDPDATAIAWAGGWLHTGDLGHMDHEGQLHLVDRIKDIVICGGLNVSTLEVEGVLAGHPAVREVAVVGVAHDVLGQDVGAAVVRSGVLDARELQAFARLALPEHKVPHRVVFLEALPRTASGKVRKAELVAMFGAPGSTRAEQGLGERVAPATAEERVIAGIWAEILGVAQLGIHDDFFEHGGHSLAATRMLARVEEDLGVRVALPTFFEGPTVAELALAVTGSSAPR
jgi:acyl-CoA synthetase (AMP-forming)/AMP-acid ligase II